MIFRKERAPEWAERLIRKMDQLNAAITELQTNIAAYIALNAGAVSAAQIATAASAVKAVADQVGALVTPAQAPTS